MPEFLVLRKIRGYQQLFVEAKNKTHAKKLVDANDISVEGWDFQIEHHGKAYCAIQSMPNRSPSDD